MSFYTPTFSGFFPLSHDITFNTKLIGAIIVKFHECKALILIGYLQKNFSLPGTYHHLKVVCRRQSHWFQSLVDRGTHFAYQHDGYRRKVL